MALATSCEYSMSLDLNKRVTTIYKAWDKLERDQYNNEIIDFDNSLFLDQTLEVKSRVEVLKLLSNLLSDLSEKDCSSLEEFHFLECRLKASLTYLSACLGENLSFSSYIYHCYGIAPRMFPEEELQESFDSIDFMFQEMGFEFNLKYLEEYENLCVLQDKTIVKPKTLERVDFWLGLLARDIELPEMQNVRVVFESADAYWANWISGSLERGLELKINTHERAKYLHGSPSMLASHEYCGHIVQGSSWSSQANTKQDDTRFSFTTVHGPEAFMMEGLADSLSFLLAEDELLSREEILARKLVRHRNLVNNNLHYMINTGNHLSDVVEYYQKYLPFDSESRIYSSLYDRSSSPLWRLYQYVYGIAQSYFLSNVPASGMRRSEFLRACYEKPMTKLQLDNLLRW